MNNLLIQIVSEPDPQQASAVVVREAVDAVRLLEPIRNLSQEVFAVLDLDGANHPIGPPRISTIGLLNCNQVHPREVFAPAITSRAASVLIAHNHPSGTLEASPDDIAITKRLVKAGEILGISILDHVILAKGGHISMKHKGLM